MRQQEDVLSIPLWINGRAYLTLAPVFHEIRNPVSGAVLRKIPLCGPQEAAEALQSARRALGVWCGLGEHRRKQLLGALGDALQGFSGHFSRMIAEETGVTGTQAALDVTEIVDLLGSPVALDVSEVVVAGGTSKRLPDVARQVVPALTAGAVAIICPALGFPSAFFALAELSGRCGFPAGVINILYLSDEAFTGLCMTNNVTVLP